MERIRKAYKVVRVENGQRVSAVVRGRAQVVYPPMEWVEPPAWLKEKLYYLTCFDTFGQAEAFIRRITRPGHYEIWEAECVPCTHRLRPCEIEDLEKGRLVPAYMDFNWPDGTIFATALRITRYMGTYTKGQTTNP